MPSIFRYYTPTDIYILAGSDSFFSGQMLLQRQHMAQSFSSSSRVPYARARRVIRSFFERVSDTFSCES